MLCPTESFGSYPLTGNTCIAFMISSTSSPGSNFRSSTKDKNLLFIKKNIGNCNSQSGQSPPQHVPVGFGPMEASGEITEDGRFPSGSPLRDTVPGAWVSSRGPQALPDNPVNRQGLWGHRLLLSPVPEIPMHSSAIRFT